MTGCISLEACGTTEVVPFPGRGACQILRGMGLWNPTLRKVREEWGTPVCDGADRQQVPRLRKIIRLADDLLRSE